MHLPHLSPGALPPGFRGLALGIDIREPAERQGAGPEILAMPNVPMAEWHSIPERFPRRPLVLCCAAGVRTRLCVERLNFPEGVYAWTGTIHQWAAPGRDGQASP
jgi:rhodanese-related sulfurtransferase